jgi:hypothetical protein
MNIALRVCDDSWVTNENGKDGGEMEVPSTGQGDGRVLSSCSCLFELLRSLNFVISFRIIFVCFAELCSYYTKLK